MKPVIAMMGAALVLVACTHTPLEARYTPVQLRAMLNAPMPLCQARATSGSALPDLEECVRDYRARRERIRAALARQHAVEIAAAPACVRNVSAPRAAIQGSGIEPDSANAMAELIARGYFVGSIAASATCAADVCRWRGEGSPYCL